MSGCTSAFARSGAAAVLVSVLAVAGSPDGLKAQAVLREFSYDELRPTALQADLGLVAATRLQSAVTGGVRLDYGRIAPRVRVLLGLSYYRAEFSREEIARLEQRIAGLVTDPEGNATVSVGSIAWADLTADLDLQYVIPQGGSVTTYLGLGASVHLRNGSGAAIRGTFLEDALDDVTAGLNGTIGAEFMLGPAWGWTLDARGVLLSDHRTVSLRAGVVYRFHPSRAP